jgi:Zn-finger nucleic acid-binding protein
MNYPECTGSLVAGKRLPFRMDYYPECSSVKYEKGKSDSPLEVTGIISNPREGGQQRFEIIKDYEPGSGGFLRGTLN